MKKTLLHLEPPCVLYRCVPDQALAERTVLRLFALLSQEWYLDPGRLARLRKATDDNSVKTKAAADSIFVTG